MVDRRSAVWRVGFLLTLCTLVVLFSGCQDIRAARDSSDESVSRSERPARKGLEKRRRHDSESDISTVDEGADGVTSGTVNANAVTASHSGELAGGHARKDGPKMKKTLKKGKGSGSQDTEKERSEAGDSAQKGRKNDAKKARTTEASGDAEMAGAPRGDKELNDKEASSERRNEGKHVGHKGAVRGKDAKGGAGAPARPPVQHSQGPTRANPKAVKPFIEQKEKKMVLVVDWHTKTLAATMNGRRPQDEDAMVVHGPLKNFPNARLKAIFDGHGGYSVSRRCASVAYGYLGAMKNLSQESFRSACLQMDADMRADTLKGGSTGLMVIIEKVDDPESRDGIYFNVHAANVGDSRGLILHSDGTYTIMSKDHKPTAEVERERIKRAGGFLLRRLGVWRVDGRLALSRAFGDFALKDRLDMKPNEQKVVALPDVNVFKAKPGDIILMGCDGIFERPEMNWHFVASLLKEELERTGGGLAEIAYRILESAFMLGSRDNVSIMLTKLVKRPIRNTQVKRFDYSFTGERYVLPSEVPVNMPTDRKSGRFGTGEDMLVTLF
ncbi:protein phosphatase 2C domain-containing protein [Toxoplasma gondii VAND]|uniref:protein-serine/threonine phosphatase n=3 Tax=Toxoplasma gondii TaxID=5811 RepID=A0A086PPF0_TOXGO|nr:protein phosphatase 2C domain-containing protein [Toxoplasma gondii VAND]KFH02232.1 protein phosphatase 2C domain-containing protein [Toxoplasma gondii MAS]PUA83560.1 protein phosphatase 2C domain-containing protein [Toxoplasma gondii TgCATBr9]